MAQWRSQIPTSWQAGRDFLARRYPGRWRPTQGLEHSGPGGGPIDLASLIHFAREDDAQREPDDGGDPDP